MAAVRWAAVLVILATACVGPAGPPSSSSAAATPARSQAAATGTPSAPAGTPAVAVLETRGQGLTGWGPYAQHDTAVLAGLDWNARARAGYAARTTQLYVGNAAAVLPPYDAYLAAGRLFYVDGNGTVSSLDAAGHVAVAARFAIGPKQQEVSFAVSPDGSRVWGTRLTLPAQGPAPSDNPFPTLVGPWKLELMAGPSDGSTKVLQQWQSNQDQYPNSPQGFQNLTLVGWDSTGPIALVGNALGTQNAWLEDQRIFTGHLSHLDGSGRPTDTITGSDCLPYSVSGTIVICTGANFQNPGSKFKVLSTGGQTMWDWTATVGSGPPNSTSGDFALSPDQRWMAMKGAILGRDGSVQALPANFVPQGWPDARTLAGRLNAKYQADGNMALVTLDNASQINDLGFSGDLIGTGQV